MDVGERSRHAGGAAPLGAGPAGSAPSSGPRASRAAATASTGSCASAGSSLVALTFAALVALAPAASAQTLTAPSGPEAGPRPARTFASTVESRLVSADTEVRHAALEEAYDAVVAGAADTDAVVPALISLVRRAPDAQSRLAAVATLHAIGDENRMGALRQTVSDQPDRRVRIAIVGALVDHYGIDALEGDRSLAAVAENLLATR